ncbi:MAG: DUF4058 family protein [Gemmataceae bacterium]|nr:DUF4058 family protein [Gemmataceae bacterium]
MKMPFPGMDPYLEHPVLWESVHARFIPVLANQLQPRLDPRYVTSIEERVFVEGPQRRIPDIWIQKATRGGELAVAEAEADTAVVLEVDDLEIHEPRVEILDTYNNQKLVAVIEVVSPANKAAGPGRESYEAKQREILVRDCHFIEIDLHRRGRHVLSIPDWRVQELRPFDYLACVSRWPQRNRFALYPRRLRERLPRIRVPLADADPDVTLDIQAALEQVYWEGRYMRRVRYDEPCEPPLEADDQQWANERWTAYKAACPDLFPQIG